jgi:hypothetical protein
MDLTMKSKLSLSNFQTYLLLPSIGTKDKASASFVLQVSAFTLAVKQPPWESVPRYDCIASSCSEPFTIQNLESCHMEMFASRITPEESGLAVCGKAVESKDPAVLPHDNTIALAPRGLFPSGVRQVLYPGQQPSYAPFKTTKKPYICPLPGCGKSFTQASSLNRHAGKHRAVEGSNTVKIKERTHDDDLVAEKERGVRSQSSSKTDGATPQHVGLQKQQQTNIDTQREPASLACNSDVQTEARHQAVSLALDAEPSLTNRETQLLDEIHSVSSALNVGPLSSNLETQLQKKRNSPLVLSTPALQQQSTEQPPKKRKVRTKFFARGRHPLPSKTTTKIPEATAPTFERNDRDLGNESSVVEIAPDASKIDRALVAGGTGAQAPKGALLQSPSEFVASQQTTAITAAVFTALEQ